MTKVARFATAFCLMAVACGEPFVPRSGVPTLDDTATDDFVAVAAGKEHTCALVAGGTAYCWGNNEAGQLGVALETDAPCTREDRPVPCETRPVAVSGGLTFRKITAGGQHTCALTAAGRVYCWGDNLRGQVGEPSVRATSMPTPIASSDVFVDVAAGGLHTCAVRTDGAIFCWGANEDGQLGVPSAGPGSAVPVAIQSSQRFASVATGARRTCARVADGGVFCWGLTWVSRQEGGGDVVRSESAPVRIPAPPTRVLAVGSASTCGITSDDRAYCWEANPSGTLGNGTTIGSLLPVQVKFNEQLAVLSVGGAHACGVATSGLAYCWGADNAGQLGVSPNLLNARCVSGLLCSPAPRAVAGWRTFVDITAGQGNHTCALGIRGTIYCWGAGAMGQRGDGRLSNEWAPVRVFRSVTMVTAMRSENR